jgi:hypothetical protein
MSYEKELVELVKKYETDRAKEHIEYVKTYDFFLKKYKDSSFNFLEVGTHLGESVKMWREYFTKAFIFSVELPRYQSRVFDRFSVSQGNKSNMFMSNDLNDTTFCFFDSTSQIMTNELFDNDFFDVVIDDGDHYPDAQLQTFNALFPKLKVGGLYFIEDIKGPLYGTHKPSNFKLICEFMDCFNNSEIRMFNGDNNILGIIKKVDNQEETDRLTLFLQGVL